MSSRSAPTAGPGERFGTHYAHDLLHTTSAAVPAAAGVVGRHRDWLGTKATTCLALGLRPTPAKATATQHRAGSGTAGESRLAVALDTPPHPLRRAGLVPVVRWRRPPPPSPRRCPEPPGRRGALQARAPFRPLPAGAALPPRPGGTNP